MSNGKTYTEVVLEFTDRLDVVEQRIVRKLDIIVADNADFKAGLARGEARFKSIDDKIDVACVGMDKKIDNNKADIKTNSDNIVKVRNLNATLTAIFSGIAGVIGLSK